MLNKVSHDNILYGYSTVYFLHVFLVAPVYVWMIQQIYKDFTCYWPS